jgi:hypothetical protein
MLSTGLRFIAKPHRFEFAKRGPLTGHAVDMTGLLSLRDHIAVMKNLTIGF